MPRDVYLSPFDMGALWSTEQSLRGSHALNAEETNLFRLLCVTLMQAGADRFSIPGGNPPAFTRSEFLLTRINSELHPIADASWRRTIEVFDPFLSAEVKPGTRDAQRLKYLIGDIVRALEAGNSMAVVAPLPDLSAAARVLPQDLIVPCKTLLHALVTDMSVVPIPIARVDKQDVAVLSELLQSDAYDNYRTAHRQLERTYVSISDGLRQVSARATALQRAARKYIHLGERVVSFLPATTKLIEELVGKAPALIGDAFVRLLSGWLASHSRLVIYRFDGILDELSSQMDKPAQPGPVP